MSDSKLKKVRLGDLLVERGLITEAQLQQALAEQRKLGLKLGHTLVQLGMVSEDQILEVLSEQLHVPVIDLRHFNFKPELVRLLPETLARRYRAIVLDRQGDEILIGMADPTDLFAYDEIARVLKARLKLAIVRERDLLAAFDIAYRRTNEIESIAEQLGQELTESDYDLEQLLQVRDVEDAPVVRLLHTLFEDAVQVGASDIHIEPDETVLRVRQRIDGVLSETVMNEKRIASAVVSRLKLMAGMDIAEKRLPQDGRFNIRVHGKSIDVRVSTMPIQHGESVVMRLLDQSSEMMDLHQLGMPDRVLERFRQVLDRPHGLILVTGPTGSGKTTTLYAALKRLNTPERKIITVEDPVEYRLPRISQVQVNPRIGLDFARVLRTALRQDPDIVMVGEIRDNETAEIGFRAALTGHLVLSTLHTNDALSTVDRLRDMGLPDYMLAAALRTIIAQRLVRRVCESCAEPYTPDDQEQAWIDAVASRLPPGTPRWRLGRGCAHCNNTGYRGRIGVYEYLELDHEMADALRRGDRDGFERLALADDSYQPLLDTALQYAATGITSLQEVLRIVGDVEDDLPPAPAPQTSQAAGAEADA
ncbi:MAG: GspE/PulE family protein [Gammaproteobacteria bacterium]|nr:MAG: GspE/PulE family protein [Gammaproteobacteria bacterium]